MCSAAAPHTREAKRKSLNIDEQIFNFSAERHGVTSKKQMLYIHRIWSALEYLTFTIRTVQITLDFSKEEITKEMSATQGSTEKVI